MAGLHQHATEQPALDLLARAVVIAVLALAILLGLPLLVELAG